MKKLFFGAMLAACLPTFAAIDSEDILTIVPKTGQTLDPGSNNEQFFVTVSLEGTSDVRYVGYSMDIVLPEGINPVFNSNGTPKLSMVKSKTGLYPYSSSWEWDDDAGEDVEKTSYTHSISSNFLVLHQTNERVIRLECHSNLNEAFTNNTGKLFNVYLKADAYAKPGDNCVTIKNIAFATKDEVQYDLADAKGVTVTTNATTKLSVSATNKWSTCILPFDLDVPEGVTAYTCNSTTTIDEANFLVLNKATTIEAYKPYIVYSENGFDSSVEGTVDGSKYPEKGYATEGYLNGAIMPQTINAGHVLQNLNGIVQFYNTANKEFVIPAGKCWATIPSTNPAQAMGFTIGNERTMIEHMIVEEDNVLYDLAGRRITNGNQQGILIKNGKKVFMNK